MIHVARNPNLSLVSQIVSDLEKRIGSRELSAGARLPSVRQMAARLGVSIFTVVTAYDKLVASGAIESRRGSGFYVTGTCAETAKLVPHAKSLPASAVELLQQLLNNDLYEMSPGAGFFPATWVADAIPPAVWAKIARTHGEETRPSPPEGTAALRTQIATRLRQVGIDTNAEQIVTTYGAGHAFDLICRSLLHPWDAVLVEEPGYFMLHAQLREYGLVLIPVSRHLDGPDVEMLENLAAKFAPKAFFTQTLLHNPVGGCTSSRKCHRILSLAERFGFLIVEDDTYGEMIENPSPRLVQLDSGRHVAYVSSYSKLLSAGIRLGFVLMPAAYRQVLIRHKISSVLTGSSFIESAVAEALATGRFRHHIDRLRAKATKARAYAARLLSGAGLILLDEQTDGIFLWAKLPDGVNGDQLVRDAHAAGILLAHGRLFSPSGEYGSYLRFSPPTSVDPRLIDFLSRATAVPKKTSLHLVQPDAGAAR